MTKRGNGYLGSTHDLLLTEDVIHLEVRCCTYYGILATV